MGRLSWNKPTAPEEERASESPSEGWEVPPAAAGGPDPWLGPGHLRPSGSSPATNPDFPFECRVCGASLRLEGAFASGGDIYCFQCRPNGAVSSLELPGGNPLAFEEPQTRELPGAFVLRLVRRAWALLSGRRGRIGW